MMFDLDCYRGKRVLVTGHSGFKGSWLCCMLVNAGARVAGYSTARPRDPFLFGLARLDEQVKQFVGDVRDADTLELAFSEWEPEIVFHLAAQPLVTMSYADPVGTFSTNVMGTVNVLECARRVGTVRSLLNVTTDKVYDNREWCWGYREGDVLDGFDPYSNSKSCSELVTHSYVRSFFTDAGIAVSTARAGNVIGGGDFSKNRIVPDCVRAAIAGRAVEVRNPNSIRPYQHVLEPLSAYLAIAHDQNKDPTLAGAYNVGPDECDCVTTGELVEMFADAWGSGFDWLALEPSGPHEAGLLKLDCSRIRAAVGWRPRWRLSKAVERTVEWTRAWVGGRDVRAVMDAQIYDFLGEMDGDHVA